ncbi:MAG: hypothetical protein ACOYM3_14880 [Terrimicrobiaceae bacterium]
MKILHCLPLVLLAAAAPLLQASDSKRTAEYIMATPTDFEGKEVSLDVAFVKPVHWKSPIPELAFFRAMTIDRQDKKPGGHILVIIPAADAGKFSKKYGMDFEGRNESNSLRGTFLAAPGGKDGHRRVWMIDTTGQAAELIKAKKLEINDEGDGDMGEGGPGPGGPGGPGHHPRRGNPN